MIEMREVKYVPWTDAERARLRELHTEGRMSRVQIARELGRTKGSIHRQLQILGLMRSDRNPILVQGEKRVTRERYPKSTLPPLPSLRDK